MSGKLQFFKSAMQLKMFIDGLAGMLLCHISALQCTFSPINLVVG